ncbi:GDSL esterase/lipase EXL3-like [Typha angustifolia]|uniref:GDSL esterase/lipase EXL3-like n=1 Tax=Typha angustifolia TaxID=59011 RepID=UPI003C2CAFB3
MENKLRLPLTASGLAGCLVVVLLCLVQTLAYDRNQTTPVVPAVFAFGDSIVDPGNNDVLPKTPIRCDFPPYGQDFIGHRPTGRFSNGKIPTDFLASGLGVKELLPPYLGVDLQPEDILTGVSFASGATGYDPLTPAIVNVITLDQQLEYFGEYKERLKAIAGEARAASIIKDSLFLVCAGTDDIANTYFTTPFRKAHYDIPSYVDLLISGATKFVTKLHQMGARKIGFVGLPPIGCVPSQRTVGGGIYRECEPTRNQAAQLFNSKIKAVLDQLAAENSATIGSKFVYIDIYNLLLELIEKPYVHGFEEVTKGCCGTGLIEVTKLCNSKFVTTCPDVTKYIFWDSYHPTERAYKILIDRILDENKQLLN